MEHIKTYISRLLEQGYSDEYTQAKAWGLYSHKHSINEIQQIIDGYNKEMKTIFNYLTINMWFGQCNS